MSIVDVMMTAKLHHRISRLLQRTIANFCRERVAFDRKLHVVGLVALNIDDDEVDVLVKMDKTFLKENETCDGEDDDEEDVEAMEYDAECKPSFSPVVLVDSSTSAPPTAAASEAVAEQEFEEGEVALSPLPDALSPQSPRIVGSPIETREEADTNFCSLEEEEEEVVPLPPPLSVIDRLHDDVDGCDADDDDLTLACSERIQICTSTSIVTPLFHHKQKRKRFRPMRLFQPDNGFVMSTVTGGSHSSEEPPSPSPYLPPVSSSEFALLPDLVDASPTGSLGYPKTVDLPLPPLPSSDTGSGEDAMEEDADTRAIVLNGVDSSVADSGDLIPLSPVPGDVVEEMMTPLNDDEELQITGEFCRQPPPPTLIPTLPATPRPPPPLTAVTLPLLSLPLTGPTGALNSIPLIPLRQVTANGTPSLVSSASQGGLVPSPAPRQFALIAPGTGILLPSSLPPGQPPQQQQHHQQQQQQQPASGGPGTAATILATAATKSLTVTAAVPVNCSSFSTVNSIISSASTVTTASSSTSSSSSARSTLLSTSSVTTSSSSSSSKAKALSILTSGGAGPRSRRSALKFHHSPITIPAAAAALRPLPTMTSSGSSVASSLMRHYNCRYCGKMFNRKFCLERHERLHTGVKPYACSCCGERFIRLEDKKRHVRTVHEPSPPGGVGIGEEKSSNGLDGPPSLVSGSTPTSGGASTNAHMLSIISAVAAAAAAASNTSNSSTAAAAGKR